MKIGFCATLFCALLASAAVRAQSMAVKTNLLYDAFLTANAGVEMAVAPRWSVDVSGNINAWNMSHDRRWKHWMLQPEARYWFCDPFAGHFVGAHVHGGQYNVGGLANSFSFLGTDFSRLSDARFQGWFVGAGVAYGYAWVLGRHWNIEAELGLGYSFTSYDRFLCAGCGRKVETGVAHHYVGLTKAAVNLVYVF